MSDFETVQRDVDDEGDQSEEEAQPEEEGEQSEEEAQPEEEGDQSEEEGVQFEYVGEPSEIEENENGAGLLLIGKEYNTVKELKDDLFAYSLKRRKNIEHKRSDSVSLTAKCCSSGCPWRLQASLHSRSKRIRINSIRDEHICVDTERNKLFKVTRLVEHFIDKIRDNMLLTPIEMRSQVLFDYRVRVSLPQCRAVRHKCLQLLKSEHVEQFERLWDYVNELRRSNTGSTIELETDGNVFKRMFIMFGALKEGWKGCRSIIHLDGAFLKGQFKGELLTAVCRDGNDQVYPVAWAIVDVENKRNWSWFIKHLRDELDISFGEGITIMSDQQKGIIFAVSELLPCAEHRMCACHIWANLKKKCNNDEIRMLFWQAAKSYTESNFGLNMDKIKGMSIVAHDELVKQDPQHWSRAFFSPMCKCDSVDNNFSESFNASITDARRLPVVQMLETIRKIVMVSIGKKIALINKHSNVITPKAQELVDAQKEVANACQVSINGGRSFEVSYKGGSYVVNLNYAASCSCKYKYLTGIPCGHLIAAAWEDSGGHLKPEYMVAECWTTERWKKVYSTVLEPVNGMSMWARTSTIKILAPHSRTMPGRPPKKNRRKEAFEIISGNTSFLSRNGRIMKCGHCHQEGHNKKTCPKKDQPPVVVEKRPRGRPRIHPPRSQESGAPSRRKRPRGGEQPATQESVEMPQISVQDAAVYREMTTDCGVYFNSTTGDTYCLYGTSAIDARDNTVLPTVLQRQRDLQEQQLRNKEKGPAEATD